MSVVKPRPHVDERHAVRRLPGKLSLAGDDVDVVDGSEKLVVLDHVGDLLGGHVAENVGDEHVGSSSHIVSFDSFVAKVSFIEDVPKTNQFWRFST